MNIHSKIKELRLGRGYTQNYLAQVAGVSLPTVQNIEAGHANPSLEILTQIFLSLGYELTAKPLPPDWGVLATLGIPITVSGPPKKMKNLTQDKLLNELSKAIVDYQTHQSLPKRELEALSAFLLGLKLHYPSFYKKLSSYDAVINEMIKKQDAGRLLKLSRIAVSKMAEYL